MPFDDVGNSILGDIEVTSDPAIASPTGDGLEHFRREFVRFRVLPGLAPESRPRARAAARPDFTRSLSRSCSNCAIPASIVVIILPCGVSRSNVMPLIATTETFQTAGTPVERVEEVLRRASPAGQLGDQ